MEKLQKEKGYWTYETCIETARKYNTRKALKDVEPSAYTIIIKNGWSTEAFKHMKRAPKSNIKWTKKAVIK